MSFLKIQNLSVDYKLRKETVHAAKDINIEIKRGEIVGCLLYTSPSPRDKTVSRMPSSA